MKFAQKIPSSGASTSRNCPGFRFLSHDLILVLLPCCLIQNVTLYPTLTKHLCLLNLAQILAFHPFVLHPLYWFIDISESKYCIEILKLKFKVSLIHSESEENQSNFKLKVLGLKLRYPRVRNRRSPLNKCSLWKIWQK